MIYIHKIITGCDKVCAYALPGTNLDYEGGVEMREKYERETRRDFYIRHCAACFWCIIFITYIFFKYTILLHIYVILLGGEVLYYALHQKQLQYKYDFAAILVIMILIVFALCMAGADWVYQHHPENYWFRI